MLPRLVATADVGDAMLDPWARSRACPGGASGAGRDFAATKALYALSPAPAASRPRIPAAGHVPGDSVSYYVLVLEQPVYCVLYVLYCIVYLIQPIHRGWGQ